MADLYRKHSGMYSFLYINQQKLTGQSKYIIHLILISTNYLGHDYQQEFIRLGGKQVSKTYDTIIFSSL